jgi:hypothetical protein
MGKAIGGIAPKAVGLWLPMTAQGRTEHNFTTPTNVRFG